MARVRLDDDNRAVEILEGWALEHRDPCMRGWHEIAIRSSLSDVMEAYEQFQNGETVEMDDDAAAE